MPIEPWNGFKLICDGCKDPEPFAYEGVGYCVAESREQAEQVVRDYEGAVDGERILCETCACKEADHPQLPPSEHSGYVFDHCACGEKRYPKEDQPRGAPNE